jgi:hypothetical protein
MTSSTAVSVPLNTAAAAMKLHGDAPPEERMFQYDESRQPLPVPKLEATFASLRDSLVAVAESDAELTEYDAQVQAAIPKLQEAQAVLHRRAETQTNYVGPWWTEFGYLRNRFPNVLNTNVFCVRDSDFDALGSPHPLSVDPVVRTALTAQESLIFRRAIMKETLPVERFGGKEPMCMAQYRRYWTTRIPGPECDVIYEPSPQECRHVGIMHRGALFFVRAVIDDASDDDLSVAELVEVIRLGLSKVRPPPLDDCVGTLTAADRDKWAVAWKELERRSANNRKIFDMLLKCVTVICLDDIPVTSLKEGINRASHELPHNRWFDRSSLRIVSSNGISMEHGDHTAMDAIVMASTPVDFMASYSRDFVRSGGLQKAPIRKGFQPAKYLDMANWDLSPSISIMIREARDAHAANCEGVEIDCYTYLGFGRDALRNAKVNSDAFVQQALQLAFFRDRGFVVPVYETASTRLFKDGRTETIRSLTPEQKLFVTSFDDQTVSTEEKTRRFAAAMKKHAAITMRASTGKGHDRHLLTLRIAQQHELRRELPHVFKLPIVTRSASYQLLTSQMVGRLFVGGFAHVMDDGYGCCYYLRRNAICIVVSGCKRAGKTDLERFKSNLTRAFHDLAQLAMAAANAESVAKMVPAPKQQQTNPAKL